MKYVDFVSVIPTEITLKEGETYQLTTRIIPEDATCGCVSWESSNPVIASVGYTGIMYAHNAGTTKIYARAQDGSGKYDFCTVTVEPKNILVSSVTLNKTAVTLYEGEEITLSATVLPENATNKAIGWSSSNYDVAYVQNGRIVGVSPGNATITVRTTDGSGKGAGCSVVVRKMPVLVTDVILNKKSMTLKRGEYGTLSATVLPADATDKTLRWESSDEYVATVENGVIYALARGTTTIWAKHFSGDIIGDFCKLTVEMEDGAVESISVTPKNRSINIGDTLQMTATISPSYAYNKEVRWSSSDTTVATVDSYTGLVTGISQGTATISAQSMDGSHVVGSTNVTVNYVPVTSISLDKTEVTLKVGERCILNATVHPNNASNKSYSWYSFDELVAKVYDGGIVMAKQIGTTSVYARINDASGIRGSCTIRVIPQTICVDSVTVTPSEKALAINESVFLNASVLPENATCGCVTWSSSNDDIVSVHPTSGLITANTYGSAIITATAQDGSNMSDSCQVDTKFDRVIITREQDPSYPVKIIWFKKANKKWRVIAYDTINNTPDTLVNSDCSFNFYVDPDLPNNVDLREYSDDEIRLLYALDPYGVADYVKRYATYDEEGGLESILFHKDRFFKILFGRQPVYFARTAANKWERTTDLSDLNAVLSESELIFGTHSIYDKFTGEKIAEKLDDFLQDLYFDALGISTIIDVAKCAYGLFVLGDSTDLQNYIFSTAVDATIETLDIGWLGFFLDAQESMNDINEIISYTVADTSHFGEIVQYNYNDSVYVLSVQLDSGDTYGMDEIYEKYDFLFNT